MTALCVKVLYNARLTDLLQLPALSSRTFLNVFTVFMLVS